MDDLISRQAAIDVLATMQGLCTSKTALVQNSKIWQQIKDLPSADAVDVVRCKDCYHYDEESEKCILNNSEMKPMDYCSYGSK